MPIATTPDQLALQASLRDWAKHTSITLLGERGALNQAGGRVLGLPR